MPQTGDVEVFAPHVNALLLCATALRGLTPQTLPGRCCAQCLDHVQARARTRLAAPCAYGAAAGLAFLYRTGAAGSLTARAAGFTDLEGREQAWRNGGLGGIQHRFCELPVHAFGSVVGIGWRPGRWGCICLLIWRLLCFRWWRLLRWLLGKAVVRLFLLRLIRLALLRRRQSRRTRCEHQTRGQGGMLFADFLLA